MNDSQHDVLYLRLPARNALRDRETIQPQEKISEPLAFALLARKRLQHTGIASLHELSQQLTQVQRVVLLVAASDVTLLRTRVPPLSATRLRAALPSLIEDRIIGDPADCAIAAGPDIEGQRVIAVLEKAWLQSWVTQLRACGAKRLHALPMQLCLPLPAGQVAAALLESSGQSELALRFSVDEGMGLPVITEDESTLASELFILLHTLTGAQSVQLFLPAARLHDFHAAQFSDGATHTSAEAGKLNRYPNIQLYEAHWELWIEGASQLHIDLLSGLDAMPEAPVDWARWRWPVRLATLLLLLNVIALNADWWRLRSEGERLQAAMLQTFQRAYPKETVVDTPLAQMRRKLAAARQSAGELAPGDFLALSLLLGDAWAEAGMEARSIARIEYRDNTLSVYFKPGVSVSAEKARAAFAARKLELSTVTSSTSASSTASSNASNAASNAASGATSSQSDAAQWHIRSIS